MVNVPLGLPLTASTSASLMSNLTSGPERIGSDGRRGRLAPGQYEPQCQNRQDSQHSSTHGAAPLGMATTPARQKWPLKRKKAHPHLSPVARKIVRNAPSAPIPGAMRQPVRIVPALDPISCASRAGTISQVLHGT